MGLLQGVTELFPVSSLGHSVILPTLLGWTNLVKAQSDPESFFLAFLVGLHLATAVALVIYYWKDWVQIVLGFFTSLGNRKISTAHEKMAWLLIVATVPTAVLALIFEHQIRTFFAKPLFAAGFLMVNGLILFLGEYLSRRNKKVKGEEELEKIQFKDAALVGTFQVGALFAGISRSGISFVGGLLCKLSHRNAAKFSFLLATPIILLAGVYKIPDLLGPNGNGVRPQILVGSLVAGVAAYLSVRFLDRYFQKRTALPYAVYCLVAGAAATGFLLFFKG